MTYIEGERLTGERTLFMANDAVISNTIFDDGESPLKHASDIEIKDSMMKWKYPLWYAKNVKVENSAIFEMGRAGIWYTSDIEIKNTSIQAPKEFRRCKNVKLENVHFSNALETFWSCDNVQMKNVEASGPYFAMNSSNISIDNLSLIGDYPFDGCKNVEIHNSKLLSKDSFWNCENVVIYDSFISGEYFAWNSKNVTLINCTVESNQGFCYVDNLVMKNCRLLNTDLAFEFSTIDVEVEGRIESVKNPLAGRIRADEIGELILDSSKIDPSKTDIKCITIEKISTDESDTNGKEGLKQTT